MENKYKIILSYIQDLSVEIPSPESLITIRNTTPEYRMSVDISTKPTKRKMLEVLTILTYSNPNKKKAQGYFQIKYATVIDILDLKIEKKELEKIILCDLQTKIYPDLEQKFLTILKNSGLPDLKFGKKIDFEELYKARLN
jgi:preprotein translocase subunit SecB